MRNGNVGEKILAQLPTQKSRQELLFLINPGMLNAKDYHTEKIFTKKLVRHENIHVLQMIFLFMKDDNK
jgi:hypothetical protein